MKRKHLGIVLEIQAAGLVLFGLFLTATFNVPIGLIIVYGLAVAAMSALGFAIIRSDRHRKP